MTPALYARVEAEIRTLHAYELPEIVAFEASDMLLPYREWVRNEARWGRRLDNRRFSNYSRGNDTLEKKEYKEA